MEGLLNLLTGISLLLLLVVLVSVRRMHVRVEYSVSWFGAALTLLVVSRSQAALDWLAGTLGIASPPLALLTLVGSLFLLVVFRLSVVVSALKDSNIALAQRVAILEYRLQSAHEKQEA
ncbi:MAG TPA: DUF2304 domain-containing protein [Bryobacteraceae bacterium]|nr:DUF2304 domain-containing protein [Bryobacteraceae bacterium]